ncbi:ribonuclease HI family protein [Arthrobacter sp. Y-9]|uniref:ribonuclease HI family protein n=1 Tax=Arthrobacter sp. Y-9 TaxID=3039385 RepID=UPI00241E98ED|nr:ribonuclease HI family protein [Arthrobacter sp. Y-9]WFR84693.1 ribonuclease HI family protein [Arthrobacter sp. Y-9]
MTITAAADGSALGNPGPAGWAWYIDDDTWRAGGWPHGTNNQGELMAVLDLLRSTAHRSDEPLKILCDSQYVINCLTKWMPGWKRKGWRKADGKPVLNVDLLKELDAALKGRNVAFEWVKGHAGHSLNEAADDRARAVATAYQRGGKSIPSGPGFPGAQPAEPQSAETRDLSTRRPDARTTPASSALSQNPHAATGSAPSATVQARQSASASPSASAYLSVSGADEAEPDLFSVLEEDFRDSAGQQDAVATVTALEKRLLEPSVRADLGEVARILHPDFEEIGSSGRTWSRDEMLLALADEDHEPIDITPLSAYRLTESTILLQYRTRSAGRTVLRSSLWILTEPAASRGTGSPGTGGRGAAGQNAGPQDAASQSTWRLRFHQGTPE